MNKLTARRLGAFIASAACVVMVPVVGTGTAHAAGCGEFDWGFRQSFRNYLRGPIANGKWELDGVGFKGSEKGADGAFVFEPSSIEKDSATSGTINLGGSVHFLGHKHGEWLLDMDMTDFKIKVDGTTAKIQLDYKSYTSDMDFSNLVKGTPISGDDVTIANIALNNTPNFDGEIDLSGNVTLTSEGNDLFLGQYGSGGQMDPASGKVNAKGQCTGSSSGGGSGSGSGGGSNNDAKEMKINDNDHPLIKSIKEMNNTMFATNQTMLTGGALIDNSEKFASKAFPNSGGNSNGGSGNSNGGNSGGITSGASGRGASGASGNGASGDATGGASGAAGGGSGAAAGAASGGGAAGTSRSAGAAQAGQAATCDAEGSKGVEQATAAWGVKKSFQTYISGSIAKGKWDLDSVGFGDGAFQWSGSQGAVDTDAKSGTVYFPGSIHFTGHHGILDMTIANLEIQFEGNSGSLIADVNSNDMEGNNTDYGRVTLANLQFSNLTVGNTSVSGSTSSVALSAAGASAFADFYEPGIQLDPLSFNATLGGSADCATGQGGSGAGGGSGAKSGAAASSAKNAAAKMGKDGASSNEGGSEFSNNGGGNFKIKSTSEEGSKQPLGFTETLLLMIAAFVVAGGALGSFVFRNPAGR